MSYSRYKGSPHPLIIGSADNVRPRSVRRTSVGKQGTSPRAARRQSSFELSRDFEVHTKAESIQDPPSGSPD